MLEKLSRKLIISIMAVFLLVLLVFSLSVYAFTRQSAFEQARSELSIIADSVISSIDFDQTERKDAGMPDSIASVIPAESSKSLQDLRLQWFDNQGKLAVEKGMLPITSSFSDRAEFQIQDQPHALILTRQAVAHGMPLGYVRVAKPLTQLDAQMNRLSIGLFTGAFVAMVASAIGTWWLLRLSLRPTENMIARLKQFTADASHEFRSPLMVIKANCGAALLLQEDMSEKQRQKLEAVGSATDQLIELTENLLTLATAEHETRSPGKSSTNVAQIIDQCLQDVASGAGHKQIEVKTVLPKSLLVNVTADELKRLCTSIIENAFCYTEAGQLLISGEQFEQQIRINFEDTGIGINPEDLPKIFDRFWRADKARSYRSGGRGLGLAIAHSIVTAYGGSIVVDSTPGVGSKFTVYLRAAGPVAH